MIHAGSRRRLLLPGARTAFRLPAGGRALMRTRPIPGSRRDRWANGCRERHRCLVALALALTPHMAMLRQLSA